MEEVFERDKMIKKIINKMLKKDMKIEDLRKVLRRRLVSAYHYNLGDYGLKDNRLCLEFVDADNEWSVYYSERGNKITDIRFPTEEAACHYMYQELCTWRCIFNGYRSY